MDEYVSMDTLIFFIMLLPQLLITVIVSRYPVCVFLWGQALAHPAYHAQSFTNIYT
jgi:hypothetical protein